MTKTQRIVYDAIINYQTEFGVSPTYEELKTICAHKSRSTTFRMVERMVDRGYLRKSAGYEARSLEVVGGFKDQETAAIVESFRLIDALIRCDSRQRLDATERLTRCLRQLSLSPKYRSITRNLLTFDRQSL